MNQHTDEALERRRGTIMVLATAMLIAMLGFVALTVDLGVLMLTKTQLQVAADASALAAAPEAGKHGSSDTEVKAISSEVASKHAAMGVAVQLLTTDTVLGTDCDISGRSDFFSAVYAPTAMVVRSGSSDYYGSMVGGELVLSGSGGIHADLSLDSSATKQGANTSTLVQ